MMLKSNSNYLKAIRVLDPQHAREDHCDGVNGIYRLAARVDLDSTMSPDGLKRYVRKLMRKLSEGAVRPNSIMIHDDLIEINWYPKGNQVVMNRGQYAGLVLQFAQFLNGLPIPDISIQDGCFNDDPNDDVKRATDDEINFFPEFNRECFGSDTGESIKVHLFTDKYGDDALWH